MKSLEKRIEEAVKKELAKDKPVIPVGISARHVHVTKEDLDTLFGKGHQLTPVKELMGGQFAAKEQVTLVGENLRVIENVRILGPERSQTQVEVSKTDARKLGINAPIRESGQLAGSMPVTLVGPKGAVSLKEGCIVAMRHIHMSPADAKAWQVNDREIVSVKTRDGIRKGILSNVLIRVDDSYSLEMHIDTDEANALGMGPDETVGIVT